MELSETDSNTNDAGKRDIETDSATALVDVRSQSSAGRRKNKVSPIKTKQLETDHEMMSIERSIDLVATETSPFLLIISIGLNTVKFLTYVSITNNNTISSDDANPGIPSILIALVFSAICMAVSGFPLFKQLLMTAGSSLSTYQGAYHDPNFYQKAFLALTELGNFAMLYVSAVFIVPAQGSPLQIVLNCTALMTIASLDEGFFRCFPFSRKKIPNYDEKYEKMEKDSQFFLTFVFIAGTIVTFFFLLFLYILYEYTNTATI